MQIIAVIKAVFDAIVALPKILEQINETISTIKLQALDDEYKKRITELEGKVNDLSKAKTNSEIAAAIASLNKRS